MKQKTIFLTLISLFTLLVGCKNNTNTNATTTSTETTSTEAQEGMINLKGTITGGGGLQVMIDKFVPLANSSLGVGKADADANGNFTFGLPKEGGVYRLRIGTQKRLFTIDGTETSVNIQTDLTKAGDYDYTLQGSKVGESTALLLKEAISGGITEANFAEKTTNAGAFGAMLVAAEAFKKSPPSEYLLGLYKNLAGKMPSNTDYSMGMNDLVNQTTAALGNPIQVGRVAPDIRMSSPDGKEYSLSQLKGKVVLLDFWASWCRPCRAANPRVVELYKKYNKKGFEVFSVSLDQPGGDEKWKAAIAADKLSWPYHVSDLQGWGSAAAKIYGVSSIPKTFLLDKDGVFVVMDANPLSNLENLENNIKKLL